MTADFTLPEITLHARTLEVFSRRQYHTVVLRVDPQQPLQILFRDLVTVSSWQGTSSSIKRPYIPHITIANGLSDQQLLATQAELIDFQFSFKPAQLTLYQKAANWPQWQPLASRPFPPLNQPPENV
jgi:2'-5' RNA ligase